MSDAAFRGPDEAAAVASIARATTELAVFSLLHHGTVEDAVRSLRADGPVLDLGPGMPDPVEVTCAAMLSAHELYRQSMDDAGSAADAVDE